MVDRLEELLVQMADEDDEEQEDALELAAERAPSAVPAPESGTGNRTEKQERAEDTESPEGAECGAVSAATADEGPGAPVLPSGWEHPPEDVLAKAEAGRKKRGALSAPEAGGSRTAEPPERMGTDMAGAADWGLEELYRRTAQAGRPASQTLPVEQAGRTVRAEEPGRAAALTVDELDRAVRRDSRRYDGGMSIF